MFYYNFWLWRCLLVYFCGNIYFNIFFGGDGIFFYNDLYIYIYYYYYYLFWYFLSFEDGIFEIILLLFFWILGEILFINFDIIFNNFDIG